MDFLDQTLPDGAANLSLDEALLLEAEAGRGGPVLRLWELASYAVVLGAAGEVAADVDEGACAADGVAILRRCSGGGTVLLGPGCLLYSLVVPLAWEGMADLTHSYRAIMGRMAAALAAERAGGSDLALADLKVSGNAQRRLRSYLLHHGTLLYAFDLGLISRYLRQPRRQPDYRRDRPHAAFVRNLPLGRGEIVERLRAAWGATEGREDWPRELVERLAAEKYRQESWNRRR